MRGVNLLTRCLHVLRPFAPPSRTFVVIPPRCNRYRVGSNGRAATFVVNAARATGLSSSVRCGLRRARHAAAVLLLPVDLVDLDGREVARLIARWRGSRRTLTARHLSGAATPLILPRHLCAAALGVTGDTGLRDWVRGLARDSIALVDMPSAAADVDTVADLERARRRRSPARTHIRAFCTKR